MAWEPADLPPRRMKGTTRPPGGEPMARRKQAGKGGSGQRSGQDRSEVAAPDHLWDALLANWPHILRMYRLCEDRGPVIVLYDIQEQRVYVYPYLDFMADLSEASQRSLQEQHE